MNTTICRMFSRRLSVRPLASLLSSPRRFTAQTQKPEFTVLFNDHAGIVATQKFIKNFYIFEWASILTFTLYSPMSGAIYLLLSLQLLKLIKRHYLDEMKTRIRLLEFSEDDKLFRFTYSDSTEPDIVSIGELRIETTYIMPNFIAIWFRFRGQSHLLQFTQDSRHNGKEKELLELITKLFRE